MRTTIAADAYLKWTSKTNPHDELRKTRNSGTSPTRISVSRRPMRSLLDEEMPKLAFTPLQPSRKSSISKSSESVTPLVSRSASPLKLISTDKSPSSNQSPCSSTQSLPSETLQAGSQATARESNKTTSPKVIKSDEEIQKADQCQQQTEMLIRQIYISMGTLQQTAIDPTPTFLTEINSNFRKLVTGLQGFPGEVVIQAELGRILLRKLNRRFIAVEDKPETFPAEELLDQLLPNSQQSGNPAQTLFTNVLTALPTDIDYLVDMKNRAGEPMWEKNANESTVTYEISCRNEKVLPRSRFSIEIDGETFETKIKTRYDFGAINVHGTQRQWDFRIVVFGFGDNEQNEALYGDFARAIQRSLYIP